MRLIDADDFFARMENDTDLCAEMEADGLNALKKYIDLQPTAYSVDKIVEELVQKKEEVQRMRNTCVALSDLEVCDIENVTYERAIKIVNNGGVDDDVCECVLLNGHQFLHETSCGNVFDMQNGFKYCPYCSKKIKVVE